MKIKQYALFAGAHYYPRRGFDDFVHSFSSLEEALEVSEDLISRAHDDDHYDAYGLFDWTQVVDLLTGEILAEADKF